MARRAPAGVRGELVAFEREAAMANTARSMSRTPVEVVNTAKLAAELVDRITISKQGHRVRVELQGETGGGAAGVMRQAEILRIMQMLKAEIAKPGWLGAAAGPPAAQSREKTAAKPARH